MAYADYLRRLLHPLRVYAMAEDSFSGAELEAIGTAMDEVSAERAEQLRQTLIPTATEEGLALWEQLMHYAPVSATMEDRRKALAALMAISWDGFTPAALSAAVLGCGVNCTITETGPLRAAGAALPGYLWTPAALVKGKVDLRVAAAGAPGAHLFVPMDYLGPDT